MHSPWGLLNQLSDKKGWSHEYMLEQISWANLQMYMADTVKLVKRKDIIQTVSKSELKEHRKRLGNG
ncbi:MULTISPECIES: hypothetical protein [Sphingobacterium]|uniref:hypothetical protein n=1 Tax=Sphingobacterium TaxID=28453 RepID=UPI00257A9268|nr:MULTISPECIES: hypothetical protein [Sphingobacterium]